MSSSKVRLFNTLSRQVEDFSPITSSEVRMYTCGPTVYDYVHLGNWRAYVFPDILRRVLAYAGFEVKQEMNITDVGHLASDADSGEDKMTKGLLREGKELNLKNMRELANFYASKFQDEAKKLNIELPAELRFASDYIKEDIELVKKLEERGFAYRTSDGIYFDTEKMSDYGALWGGVKKVDESQARITENTEKKNPRDFALWKFSAQGARLPDGQGSASGGKIGFPSPWGLGFPGWHIECSAMSMKFLGEQFDIHTGGIDLIPTHHTNEIAQSESATSKKPFVRVWMHNEHVDIGGERMAKSAGNFLKVGTLIEKGLNPVAYRFWLLMGHYRTKLNFSWEALEGAASALKRLYALYIALGPAPELAGKHEVGEVSRKYQEAFQKHVFDDLDTPRALTVLWDVLKDEKLSSADKKATVLDFDKVLGLGFADLKAEKIPVSVTKLAREREEARKKKDFKKSDELRKEINALGYDIKDTEKGQKINKK